MIIFLLVFALICLILQFGFHLGGEVWLPLMTLATVFPPLLSGLHRSTIPEEDALKDDPDDELAEIVEITIRQDGVITGRDRGMLTSFDHALVFAGRRSSFIVGAQHIDRKGRGWLASDIIPLKHRDRRVTVEIVLQSSSHWQRPGAGKLGQYLADFVRYHRTPTDLAALYPPLSKDPTISIPGRWRDSLYFAIVGVFVLLVFELFTRYWPLIGIIAPVFAIAMWFYKEPASSIHARRLLQQLERETPAIEGAATHVDAELSLHQN